MPNEPAALKPTRGVLYIVWGESINTLLQRSIKSLQTYHPELPYHVYRMPAGSNLMCKAQMFDLSPFQTTLYLDADTVVLGRLDFAFEKAERHGLACSICECPWARRHIALQEAGDVIEYNTGVLFFSQSVKGVFDAWKNLALTMDNTLWGIDPKTQQPATMLNHDQGSLAIAIENAGLCPFVLPMNYNFRWFWHRTFYGPIRVWHANDEVPAEIQRISTEQSNAGNIITHGIIQVPDETPAPRA